jgi:AcrR family transcriptional regulator
MAGRKLERTDLDPRRLPSQRRSREKVELILDTTTVLLEEVGVDGFTTNLLAERAGIPVSNFYRYFPNKLAVIVALATRVAKEWDEWFEGFESLSDPDRDLAQAFAVIVDRYVEKVQRQPGGVAIRRAMQAIPELNEIERRDNDGLAKQFADAMRRRGNKAPTLTLRAAGRMLLDANAVMVDDLLLHNSKMSRRVFQEAKRMTRAYLELLDG